VDRADVVVLKGGNSFGLVNEALLGFRVGGQLRWEKLESNIAVELEVLGLVDHTHTSTANLLEYLIV
jgi:hypothetical protein